MRKIGFPHKIVPVAVSYSNTNPFSTFTMTHVLWRCQHCGRLRTQTLQGKWTMADITDQNKIKLKGGGVI
jgi:hypothetical protein